MASISCVIVNYNNASYLGNAVSSVLRQSHHVDEIIIADDCSSDESREIIQNLAEKHRVIRPILRERNIGVAANRDLAIREAEGELVTTLDSDDWFSDGKIEREYSALVVENADISFSDIRIVTADLNDKKYKNMRRVPVKSRSDMVRWIAYRLGPIPRDMLMKKSVYLESGGYRHGLHVFEDWDLKIRLACMPVKWVYSYGEGICYRITGTGLSSGRVSLHYLNQMEILARDKNVMRSIIGQKGYLTARVLCMVRNAVKWIVEIFSRAN